MTEDEKKERIASLKQQAERMATIVDKIKNSLAAEVVAADQLQEVIAYAVPGVLDDVDVRMFVVGKGAMLLLESVKQHGSIQGLLDEMERRMETLRYEADEMEHPEKYDMMCKAEAGEDSAAPTVEND